VAEEPDPGASSAATALPVPTEGRVRRRAAHLYGLIICGAVLASSSDTPRLVGVAAVLLGTLAIYWVAEAYTHWMAVRIVRRRPLTRAEQRSAVRDGLPLVAASVVPVLVLLLEALLRVDTARGVRIALWVNAVLLLSVGWRMSTEGGLVGWRRVGLATMTGLLGVAMVGLKSLLH